MHAAATLVCVFVCVPTGSVQELPRFTSQRVRQLAEAPDAKPYTELAAAFEARSAERLAAMAERHAPAFSAVRTMMRCGCCGTREARMTRDDTSAPNDDK